MKPARKYWRARITYRTLTGDKTAIKHVDAPDSEKAKARAVSYCRMPIRDNVVSVALVPIPAIEFLC